MVENPVQQTTQGGIGRRTSLGIQMRIVGRERMMGYHLQDGKSKTGAVWLSLTLQGYTNSTSAGVNVKMQQSLIFNC